MIKSVIFGLKLDIKVVILGQNVSGDGKERHPNFGDHNILRMQSELATITLPLLGLTGGST